MKDKINFNVFNQLIFYLFPISIVFSNLISNLFVLYFSFFGIYKIIVNKDYKLLNLKIIKFFTLFCFFIFINVLIIDANFLSVKSSSLLIRYLFFIFGIFYLYKAYNKIFYNFFVIYFLIFIFLLLDSNFQFFNNGINLFDFNSYAIQTNRISSLFEEELILGSFIQKFTILAVCYFYSVQNKKSNLLIFFLLIASIQICFISGERAALFSILIFFYVYLFLFSQFSKKIKILIFFSSITVFSFFIHENVQIKNRMILNTIESINSSETIYFSPGHKKHLDNAIELFKNKPISGHGTNNFRKACKKVDQKLKIYGCSTHPHNLLAQFMSEKGIIGLIFLVLFYGYIILNIFKCFSNFTEDNYRKIALLFFAILIFFNPLFPSHNFYNSWVNNIISIIFVFFLIIHSKKINA